MAEKVIIIGSGPAGWTAALYAARANLSPLVFAGRPKQAVLPGGQLMFTTDVENFPGYPKGVTGPEMMKHLEEQALRFGARVQTDSGQPPDVEMPGHEYEYQDVMKVDLSVRPFQAISDKDETYEAEALIVATGASANWMGLENEQRLARMGGGVSACAVCDGALPIFRDKVLGVVGGGDSAMEEALYLTKFAAKVCVIHRRDELRASKVMQQRALGNERIEMLWNKIPIDVLGDQMISGVRLQDTMTGAESDLELAGLFMAIGHTPATGFLAGQLELDEKRYVKLRDPYRTTTSVEGVFAAGDVVDSVYRQAITAAGMGCKAAIDAERWLAEREAE